MSTIEPKHVDRFQHAVSGWQAWLDLMWQHAPVLARRVAPKGVRTMCGLTAPLALPVDEIGKPLCPQCQRVMKDQTTDPMGREFQLVVAVAVLAVLCLALIGV